MNKYHSKPVEIDGIYFDSIAESRRYAELKLLEQAGEISNLVVHPTFTLQPSFVYNDKQERPIFYEADFKYYTDDNGTIVEDVKGFKTEIYKLKRKMFLYTYPEYTFIEVGV